MFRCATCAFCVCSVPCAYIVSYRQHNAPYMYTVILPFVFTIFWSSSGAATATVSAAVPEKISKGKPVSNLSHSLFGSPDENEDIFAPKSTAANEVLIFFCILYCAMLCILHDTYFHPYIVHCVCVCLCGGCTCICHGISLLRTTKNHCISLLLNIVYMLT